jgi:hypothetical protein
MNTVQNIRVFFAKINGFLSGIPHHNPDDPIVCRSLDDLFDPGPWYVETYWSVRRTIRRIWEFPGDTYRQTKWFIQRGRCGWADCDTWSLDYYLNGWMPAALRHPKEHKHGTPMSMFPTGPEWIDENGNPTKAAHDVAIRRWDEVLGKMIAGFEASRRINDGMYEDELGEYPTRRPAGTSKDAWEKVINDRMAAMRLLEERDEKIRVDGMTLFVEHYHSLWD